jgi:hypothetical protein
VNLATFYLSDQDDFHSTWRSTTQKDVITSLCALINSLQKYLLLYSRIHSTVITRATKQAYCCIFSISHSGAPSAILYQSDRSVGLNIDFVQKFRSLCWISHPTHKFAICLTDIINSPYWEVSVSPQCIDVIKSNNIFTVTRSSGIEWGGWKM